MEEIRGSILDNFESGRTHVTDEYQNMNAVAEMQASKISHKIERLVAKELTDLFEEKDA